MGVNEFAEKLKRHGFENQNGFLMEAALDLQSVARKSWHPVSEPPTEADAQPQQWDGGVMVRWVDGMITIEDRDDVANRLYEGMTHWAGIRDVVLLPPEE